MNTLESIQSVEDFWTREFAYYLNEHRNPLNRATHMIGISTLIATGVVGLALWNGWVILLGQIVGWAFQRLGHRIEGNRPARDGDREGIGIRSATGCRSQAGVLGAEERQVRLEIRGKPWRGREI